MNWGWFTKPCYNWCKFPDLFNTLISWPQYYVYNMNTINNSRFSFHNLMKLFYKCQYFRLQYWLYFTCLGYYVAAVQPISTLQLSIEEMSEIMNTELTKNCSGFETVRCGFIGEVGSSWPIQGKLLPASLLKYSVNISS